MAPNSVFLTTLLVAAMAFPVGAAAASAGQTSPDSVETVSVGRFLVELARALDPTLPDAVTVDAAIPVLERAGLDINAKIDVQQALTEKDIVHFTRGVGITIRTRHPDDLFPVAKLDALRVMLNGRLTVPDDAITRQSFSTTRSGENNAGGSARAREKRKKKKVFESPHIPPGQRGKH